MKRSGAQRPHCAKGRDPRTPASWRHLLLRVVAATAGAQWSDGREVRPTSLPSSSTVVTVSAGLHWTDAKHRFRRFPISLDGPRIQSIDKVLNFLVMFRETWYPQWHCSGDRRVPTDAVPGQIALNDWCLVVTVQTTVEVPQLLGVPVEIPQVQFLDKFDTSVVCNDSSRGRCLGSSVLGQV